MTRNLSLVCLLGTFLSFVSLGCTEQEVGPLPPRVSPGPTDDGGLPVRDSGVSARDGGSTVDGGVAADGGSPGTDAGPPFAISTQNRLVWKRYRTFERDLLAALALDPGSLCLELGRFSCVDFIHLVPLGGNDPFQSGQYTPMPAPVVNTPIAVDRVVLSGCGRRVDLDAAGTPLVFDAIDLDVPALSLADPAMSTSVDSTITSLFRRFHARDPQPVEKEALRSLTVDDDGSPISSRDFAKLACFAIATSTEFLFY